MANYLEKLNSLVDEPQLHNAHTHNCATTIQIHANALRVEALPPIDWSVIASGHVDELLYYPGAIRSALPLNELRKLSRVDLEMQKEEGEDFSSTMQERTGN